MAIKNSVRILRIFLLSMTFVCGAQVNSLIASDHMILVSTFHHADNRNMPFGLHEDWTVKVWTGVPDVQVLINQNSQVLRLRSEQSSVSVHKRIRINVQKYSQVRWEWKVTSLPDGADARQGVHDDQAAGLYVVFPRFPAFLNSCIIGYVWDTSAPVGTVLESQNNSQVHYIVMKSGRANLGEWHIEERDVLADYMMIFQEAPPIVGGVSLMIDSDHTQSSAESYFRDIRFLAQSMESQP